MTDHLQQAIEEAQLTANLNTAKVFFKLSPEMKRLIQQVVEETVEIAEPHIRAMIAEEIEAEDAKRHQEYRAGNWDNGYTSEWSSGMADAALIAEGKKE